MKLEVGKTYKTRDGQPVKIIHNDGQAIWPFWGQHPALGRLCWEKDGAFSFDRKKHKLDLIEEVTPTPETPS